MKIQKIDSIQNVQHSKLGQDLCRAFYYEPNFTYIFPNDERRKKALGWFFGTFVVNLGKIYGEVYTPESYSGAAIWMEPEEKVNFAGAIRAGLLKMPFHFSLGEMKRSMQLSNHVEQIREEYAPQFHWYLMALGVDPDVQGRGLGSLLLEPVLSHADSVGSDCYLETFSEQSRSFYTKFGFEVIEEHQIPQNGPIFWSMSREPSS